MQFKLVNFVMCILPQLKNKGGTYAVLCNLRSALTVSTLRLLKVREHLIFIFVPQNMALCRRTVGGEALPAARVRNAQV